MSEDIRHKGSIVSVFDGGVDVAITPEAACASCKVKGACGMDDSKERIIMVDTPYYNSFRVGEEVEVSIKQVMGFKAVFYVYILPFLLVFFSLVALIKIGLDEGASGLIALGMLVLYYLLLYLFRRKIEKEISFKVEKI